MFTLDRQTDGRTDRQGDSYAREPNKTFDQQISLDPANKQETQYVRFRYELGYYQFVQSQNWYSRFLRLNKKSCHHQGFHTNKET